MLTSKTVNQVAYGYHAYCNAQAPLVSFTDYRLLSVWFGTGSGTSSFVTAGIFLAACITDFLDGYLARKMVSFLVYCSHSFLQYPNELTQSTALQ